MGGRAGIWEAVTFPVLSLGGSLLPTLPLDLVGVCVWGALSRGNESGRRWQQTSHTDARDPGRDQLGASCLTSSLEWLSFLPHLP